MLKLLKQFLMIAVCGALVIACSSTKAPSKTTDVDDGAQKTQEEQMDKTATTSTTPNAVYFEFNKYDVQDQYGAIVDQNAHYLVANMEAAIQVKGNTDDIGSVEYNLALGQRRADAVKKALILAGAKHGQVEAVSNGKLKPVFANDNDANRALNRRADITYKGDAPKSYKLDTNDIPLVGDDFVATTKEQVAQ